ncbi:LuxR C-terminal-related transcriptional regulator [Aeromonas veronii]|uniref:LuxR C-terminal-related transcriptional regulator n=1 Tax=Aeromonas veronii TaxID=654 RepID=UPI001F279B4F|nr:LuxR C-terminal-related transcriptional regulator [Aeromonas veronii]
MRGNTQAVARVYTSDAEPRGSLSLRELEVCQWAAEGKQVSDIARILGIPPGRWFFTWNALWRRRGLAASIRQFL